MASRPKRHHQVPRFYLERFGSGGMVLVRRRDGGRFRTSPLNVAVESGFYNLPDGAGGVSHEVESGLADIETQTEAVLRDVDRDCRPPGADDPDRAVLALFMALQMVRTTDHRERVLFPQRVVEWAAGREVTRALVAEYLETEHLGFVPTAGEVEGAWSVVKVSMDDPSVLTDEFAIQMMLRAVPELGSRLLRLNWTVEVDRHREFITSDSPVVLWRKPTPRDNFEGLGIDNADELRFPLDPGKQLVLSRRKREPVIEVAVHRVRRSNAEMAGACHRFIVGNPANPIPVDAQRLDTWRPVIRFATGPLLEEGPGGGLRHKGGDVIHMWRPRRAGVGRPSDARERRKPT
jgi:hypothetical protein